MIRELTSRPSECSSTPSQHPELSIPLHPNFEPIARMTQQVVGRVLSEHEEYKEPVTKAHDDGTGQTWSWIEIVPAALSSQAVILAALDKKSPDIVRMKINSYIEDKTSGSSLTWEKVWGEGSWRVEDLKRDEEGEKFEIFVKEALSRSLEDVADREMIIDSLRRKAQK